MDFLSAAADFLTGGASGALGGLLGSVFGFGKAWLDKRHELKVIEAKAKEKEADRAHDLALMDREAEIDLAKTAASVTGRLNEADLANLEKFLEAEAKEQETLQGLADKLGKFSGMVAALLLFFAEFIRKMMRPVITTALVAATFKIAADLGVNLSDFDAATRSGLFLKVIDQVLFLTSVAVCFWFVSRPHAGRELPTYAGAKS